MYYKRFAFGLATSDTGGINIGLRI